MSDEEITVPSGPFVWWGRQVARVLAPRAGLGAIDRIGASIMAGHILAGAVLAVVGVPLLWVPSLMLGVVSASRYVSNCQARQEKLIAGLREENPEMEVHRI